MKGFKMGCLDENGNLVEIPENIQKHIEAREEHWFDKMKEIDKKCGVLLDQLALTEKALELACNDLYWICAFSGKFTKEEFISRKIDYYNKKAKEINNDN